MKVSTCKHRHQTKQEAAGELEKALSKLRSAGIRITNPRRIVLEALLEFSQPKSAEELFQSLKRSGLDLVTVYRTLQLLLENNFVTKFDFSDGIRRYEYRKHHHHYIECKSCGEMQALEGCEFEANILKLLERRGFQLVEHTLNVVGVCPTCA